MRISFITTVLNEENSIKPLLESLNSQTLLHNEAIIVDGGSTDDTLSVISNFKSSISNKKIKVRVLAKKGNRSVGRNEAIENSTGEIIVCTDAGCILEKNWLKNITKDFTNKEVGVVAGYYEGKAKNVFEKSLLPYVLTMKDKIDPNNFLPATRSMAIRKSAWTEAGRFNEELSNNEDYEFSQRLRRKRISIAFARDAIVYWEPRKNTIEAFIMFYRFALGDAEAGILRPKVVFIFVRYAIGLVMVVLFLKTDIFFSIIFLALGTFAYTVWAILKNFKYVKEAEAFYYLPLLQLVSDAAVLLGTSLGLIKRLGK